jgi:hypothetical protein
MCNKLTCHVPEKLGELKNSTAILYKLYKFNPINNKLQTNNQKIYNLGLKNETREKTHSTATKPNSQRFNITHSTAATQNSIPQR